MANHLILHKLSIDHNIFHLAYFLLDLFFRRLATLFHDYLDGFNGNTGASDQFIILFQDKHLQVIAVIREQVLELLFERCLVQWGELFLQKYELLIT